MESKSREQFEAWFKKEVFLLRPTPTILQGYWDAWQSSRAALVVELPEMVDFELLDEKQVKAAIRAAGITVKGEEDEA